MTTGCSRNGLNTRSRQGRKVKKRKRRGNMDDMSMPSHRPRTGIVSASLALSLRWSVTGVTWSVKGCERLPCRFHSVACLFFVDDERSQECRLERQNAHRLRGYLHEMWCHRFGLSLVPGMVKVVASATEEVDVVNLPPQTHPIPLNEPLSTRQTRFFRNHGIYDCSFVCGIPFNHFHILCTLLPPLSYATTHP